MTSLQKRTAEHRGFRQSFAASFAPLRRNDLFAGNPILAIVTDDAYCRWRLYLLDDGLSIADAEEIKERPVMCDATVRSAIARCTTLIPVGDLTQYRLQVGGSAQRRQVHPQAHNRLRHSSGRMPINTISAPSNRHMALIASNPCATWLSTTGTPVISTSR